MSRLRSFLYTLLLLLVTLPGRAEIPWAETGGDGQAVVHLYFFWSLRCPHCTAAHPEIEAIARARPWVRLHDLELTRHPENVTRYRAMAKEIGESAASVPAFLFCGGMQVGWGAGAADFIAGQLDACHQQLQGGAGMVRASTGPPRLPPIESPLIGRFDPDQLSLPTLALVLAGLDAFNPCALFVLLFLLSMLAHQKSRARMLAAGHDHRAG